MWDEAAEFDPLSDVERSQLGLAAADARMRPWQNDASECDSAAGAPYDPDRLAPGVVQDEIAVDVANSACSQEIAKSGNTPRLAYQLGRALLAKHDAAGAQREFELAISGGYRAARIDLADLLVEPFRGNARFRPCRFALRTSLAGWSADRCLRARPSLRVRSARPERRPRALASPRSVESMVLVSERCRRGRTECTRTLRGARRKLRCHREPSAKKNALLLKAFNYYATAAERAQDVDWPDDAWRNWRYRRATLARLLAHDGMMQQVADAYSEVRNKWRPLPPTLLQKITSRLRE